MITLASSSDIDEIYALAAGLAPEVLEDTFGGYLMSDLTSEDYHRSLSTGELLVSRDDKAINGFLVAFASGSTDVVLLSAEKRLDEVTWTDRDIRHLSKRAYIAQVGVLREYWGNGVGRALHHELFDKYPTYAFYCGVVEHPISNEASALFYQRLGFSRVGFWERESVRNFSGYKSGRYLKIGSE